MVCILFSQKTDYALRALSYLAKHKNDGLISTAELSKKLKIPRVFLAKIIQKLAGEGVVKSQKGKSGGVKIIDSRIKILNIVEIFDPEFHFIKCTGKNHTCFLKSNCNIRKILNKLESDFRGNLGKISIEEAAK